MITINLLPKELRKVERRLALPNKAYIAVGVASLLGLHILLFLAGVSKEIQVTALRRTWTEVEPRSKDASDVRRQMKELETEAEAFKKALSRRASLTEVLSSLNAAVPKGLWLERFSYVGTDSRLLIQGSVVSLTQSEMTIIGKFLQDLKTSKVFDAMLAKLELNSVQRRMIKTYDVVDFVLVGELKK